MRKTTALLAGSIAVVGACALIAPSAMAATATPTPTPSTSTGAMVGTNPGTWTPVTVKKAAKGSTIKLVKDQAFIFHGFVDKVKFKSSNPKVVVVTNAEGKGTYTASAGGHAVAPGTAKVTATNGKTVVATYTFEVK
ncbi:MAG: hypothetical protein PHN51_01185 [Candidatus Nanopelagicales bacterium]|nr:hypothetical protein [Candidatus Nanopelagicales bacterium]